MTVEEAVQLVIQAGAIGECGRADPRHGHARRIAASPGSSSPRLLDRSRSSTRDSGPGEAPRGPLGGRRAAGADRPFVDHLGVRPAHGPQGARRRRRRPRGFDRRARGRRLPPLTRPAQQNAARDGRRGSGCRPPRRPGRPAARSTRRTTSRHGSAQRTPIACRGAAPARPSSRSRPPPVEPRTPRHASAPRRPEPWGGDIEDLPWLVEPVAPVAEPQAARIEPPRSSPKPRRPGADRGGRGRAHRLGRRPVHRRRRGRSPP